MKSVSSEISFHFAQNQTSECKIRPLSVLFPLKSPILDDSPRKSNLLVHCISLVPHFSPNGSSGTPVVPATIFISGHGEKSSKKISGNHLRGGAGGNKIFGGGPIFDVFLHF